MSDQTGDFCGLCGCCVTMNPEKVAPILVGDVTLCWDCQRVFDRWLVSALRQFRVDEECGRF